jgi:hypothetical protein
MLAFIILLSICICISIISYYGNNGDTDCAVAGFIIPFIISTIICGLILIKSYNGYIKLKTTIATIEQYQEAIDLYSEKGIEEFYMKNHKPVSITDLKYQNYQSKMGQMITDLRDVIITYNKILTTKKILKNNIFINWLIILPDDLNFIKMSEHIKQ